MWAPALATLAVITIVVGNVGAIGQSSVKRMLAYSSVAQAGYMLAGVVVSTRLGASAVVFYLFAYTVMNLAAFAVVVARERETPYGDDLRALHGLGAERPWLAWPMTIAMLSLGRLPGDRGLLREDLPDRGVGRQRLRVPRRRDRARLGDLARVLPAGRGGGVARRARGVARAGAARAGDRGRVAGGRRRARRRRPPRRRDFPVALIAVVCAIATVALGIYPEPLFDVAKDAGAALTGLL